MSTSVDRILTGDVLAGIVSVFGGLTPAELRRACQEVLFRAEGERVGDEAVDRVIGDAVDEYYLYDVDERGLLIPGPVAFPELPEFAEDLPLLLDVEERDVDRTRAARELVASLCEELGADPEPERVAAIEQLSYDIEAWASVDASDLRE